MTEGLPQRRPRGELHPVWYAAGIQQLAAILGISPLEVPKVFRRIRPRPLALRAGSELLRRYPAADAARLGPWLRVWTGTNEYLDALAAGGKHVSLDGAEAEDITPDHQAHAQQQIEARRAAALARKAQVAA
jgi:hypothetical protein